MTHSLFNSEMFSFKKVSKTISLGIITLSVSTTSFAEEIASNSFSASKSKISADVRNNTLEQSKVPAVADQLTGKATGKERNAIKQKMASSTNLTNSTSQTDSANQANSKNQDDQVFTNIIPEYSIYSASASLIDDIDMDGYFRTFSISFDADVLSGYEDIEITSEVYAELYLSKNGGPWIHYYTTDNFIIDGDTTDDEHEVITTLRTGYTSNEYDVLIDLYEVGFEDVVATISSDDINELYGLPLESANNDVIYEVYHGGSFSIIGIMSLLLLALRRGIKRGVKHSTKHNIKQS